jgi:hypothetical protein
VAYEGVIAICNGIVNSPVRLIAAELVASVAVMRFADWRRNAEELNRRSSISELEALFALEDPRDADLGGRRHWPSRPA